MTTTKTQYPLTSKVQLRMVGMAFALILLTIDLLSGH
jgi:hypothetical protein